MLSRLINVFRRGFGRHSDKELVVAEEFTPELEDKYTTTIHYEKKGTKTTPISHGYIIRQLINGSWVLEKECWEGKKAVDMSCPRLTWAPGDSHYKDCVVKYKVVILRKANDAIALREGV